MSLQKLLIGTAVVGGIGWGYKTFLEKEADKLQVVVKPIIHGFNKDGFVVRLDVTLKNPSQADFTFRQPFVVLKYNGTQIGSSQVSKAEKFFPHGSEKNFDPIMYTIPYMDLLFLGLQVLSEIQAGNAGLKVEAFVSTYTNLLWVIPHEVTETVPIYIKPAKQIAA